MHFGRSIALSLLLGTAIGAWAAAVPAMAVSPAKDAWRDPALSADARASALVSAMTLDEKIQMVFGQFGSVKADKGYVPPADARMGSAGYVAGIARLGIPSQWITDAGLGVATQRDTTGPYRERTALPASILTAAGWNPDAAFRGGEMIGAEARASGFNVLLGGGINLLREPRGGRNFEYAGEDPLLAGKTIGAAISGIQSNHVISTIKHFAFNAQETGRMVISADIDDAAARQSDLLAFEIAIEIGKPGAVMCAYNRVNTIYACENDALLNGVLKGDWRYRGYVMSDWGAVHSTERAALAGMDQQSAHVFDPQPYFGPLLKAAVQKGQVPESRLNDMVHRILYAVFATGVYDNPVVPAPIDMEAHKRVAQAGAEEGIVLLKNDGDVLPLSKGVRRVVVIGSHADKGVMTGGGSSTVFPPGITAVAGIGPKGWPGPVVFQPSSPLAALRAQLPDTTFEYLDGTDAQAAAKAARKADLAIVFASQWSTEDADHDLTLPDGQDGLISAVAAANAKTVVVLQTGGPVFMPWLSSVAGVVEAWFPGAGGGDAIGRVLSGAVDASGRLPLTFPASLDQLAHPALPGAGTDGKPFSVAYSEGAAVGYKWFAKNGLSPAYPFGHGLSYTHFSFDGLKADAANGKLTVSFRVTNTGAHAGKAVPQIYVGPKFAAEGWEAPYRLAGWDKVTLQPGESRTVTVSVDPRVLAHFDTAGHAWSVADGVYAVRLATSSQDRGQSVDVTLSAARFPLPYNP